MRQVGTCWCVASVGALLPLRSGLEAVDFSASRPQPRAGVTLELPLLGQVLSLCVPWTGLHSHTPNLAKAQQRRAARVVRDSGGATASGAAASGAAASAAPEGAASRVGPGGAASGGPASTGAAPLPTGGSARSCGPLGAMGAPRFTSVGSLWHADHLVPPGHGPEASPSGCGATRDGVEAGREAATSPDPPEPLVRPPDPFPVSIGELFDAKHATELPGMFQVRSDAHVVSHDNTLELLAVSHERAASRGG
jgi:hypothetical protein